MSAQTQQSEAEQHTEFFGTYYREDVDELAGRYPSEQSWITVEWSDLFMYDADLAEDYLEAPEHMGEILSAALREYSSHPVDLTDVDIRVVGLNEEDIYTPLEVTRDVEDRDENYVGVRGDLAKVTTPKKEAQQVAFECQRCETMSYIPQEGSEFAEPHECQGCERQGPFRVTHSETEFSHHVKVRIETPPDERGALQNEHIDGDVRGSLVWEGADEFGLAERSGDSVTMYGTVEKEQITEGRSKTRFFEDYFNVHAVEFEGDKDDVDIDAHKEAFMELAAQEDAVDVFAESLVPQLHATPEWERALELLVAYLFAAPRIDVPDGPTYRGDIHALIVSGYGMGKSMVNSAVANYSPKCIKEAVTGMSSDVSLLAAAVEDDFGSGGWTLKPGILVRANGGHVILDEIDKTDADLERMNNALEGEQVVDVDKAGQQATFKSRVGLLATGNPEGSRFDATVPISEQLDIDQSLLSRFDGIVTMSDDADPEQDKDIAETVGRSMLEAMEYQEGDREEFDQLSRVVSPDMGRAWIAYARRECQPKVTMDHVQDIAQWYASEVRQLNEEFAQDTSTGQDMPVPVSTRTVADTIRASVAFARVHLRDEVADVDVERAKSLQRSLVGQTFDEESGTFGREELRGAPQADRKDRIWNALSETEAMTPAEIAHNANIDDEEMVREELENLATRGEVIRPQTGEYRRT